MTPTTREIIESFSHLGTNLITKRNAEIASLINPKWINSRRGRSYCRVTPLEAYYSDSLGLTPAEPWLPNSGFGTILAPSQQSFDYCTQSGIAEDQVVVTGAEWNDRFAQCEATRTVRKAKLLKQIRANLSILPKHLSYLAEPLKKNDRIVVVSWPPNQWPRSAVGFDDYMSLCRQLTVSLAQVQINGHANVAVSLHPTSTDPQIIEMLQKAGIFVMRESLADYIDCSEIFISTVSSTAYWAMQCGIPNIVFDGYLYGYREFSDAGAITVTTVQQMLESTEKLLEDDGFYREVQNRTFEKSNYFMMKDGRSLERILDALGKMTSQNAS